MNLKQAVESIPRTFDMLGVNLSMPNKTAVIPYLDEVSQEAQLIGAVNTIEVHEKGRLIGYNTDGAGFMQSVQEAGISVKKKVTLLGAGGQQRQSLFKRR